jgi:hypothetical protein
MPGLWYAIRTIAAWLRRADLDNTSDQKSGVVAVSCIYHQDLIV